MAWRGSSGEAGGCSVPWRTGEVMARTARRGAEKELPAWVEVDEKRLSSWWLCFSYACLGFSWYAFPQTLLVDFSCLCG